MELEGESSKLASHESPSPSRGAVSTSTSSFSPLDAHDPRLSAYATDMFTKTSLYLQGEISTVLDDYKLLEDMNRAAITKYSDMKQIASNAAKTLAKSNEKYLELNSYLEQIHQIEDSVSKLEQAAYKLDAYSKNLENKFLQLQKR